MRENGETASDYWITLEKNYYPFFSRKKLVWFLHRFGLKTVIDFAHFGLKSGIVFDGATMVYEHIYRLVPSE